MGSYAECWLESLYVGSTKNDFDYGLMQLFRAGDKRVLRSTVNDLPKPMHRWTDRVEDRKEKINVVYYTAPACLIKDRLDLKGYTLSTARRAFMKRMRAQAREYTSEVYKGMEDYFQKRASLLEALDVDEWLTTLRRMKDKNLEFPPWAAHQHVEVVTLEDFMLEQDWYGFPGVDLYVPLRLALEVCEEKDNFIYDLTGLIDGGYLKKNDDFVGIASEFASDEHISSSKIIILTEGRSTVGEGRDRTAQCSGHRGEFAS